jgi:hypothetical protein
MARHFLVLEAGANEPPAVGFETVLAGPGKKRSLSPAAPAPQVLPITKAPGNPYPDRVSVGRARNCDVVVRDASVSKLHAHFTVNGPTIELVDSGSQNGTRVNGRVLVPHQPMTLVTGDLLMFGNLRARFLDETMVNEWLKVPSKG